MNDLNIKEHNEEIQRIKYRFLGKQTQIEGLSTAKHISERFAQYLTSMAALNRYHEFAQHGLRIINREEFLVLLSQGDRQKFHETISEMPNICKRGLNEIRQIYPDSQSEIQELVRLAEETYSNIEVVCKTILKGEIER